jgi:hypothetical protein
MKIINKLLIVAAVSVGVAACSKKLDLFPQNDLTPEKTYSTATGYKSVLAKIYAGLALTGNEGPSGQPDIGGGLDEGSQVPFIRGFFNHQELPTDEAVVAWNDQTIHDFHNLRWTPADPFIRGMYARPIWNITLMNEYLREASDEKLAERGITGNDATEIKRAVAEVRFLRAFNYWVMLDLFGKSTFITEANKVGTELPGEISRPVLFRYVANELLAVESQLAAAKTAEYGRVDKAAAWALLARLYLNAEVYGANNYPQDKGAAKYDSAIIYASKIIDANQYSLHSNYAQLFMADNDKRTNELIWTVNNDGLRTRSFGNTSFFVHAASGDDHNDYGVGSGWNGYRSTKGLADKFSDLTGTTDRRALFTTSKYQPTATQIEIPSISDFSNGLHVKKYVNLRSDGQAVSDPNKEYADIDYPIFRLSEIYLIYAEATLRNGAGGDRTKALDYVNRVRNRAFGGASGHISSTQLDLQFVLDERARELYWEGHRRTDLVRYNLLTTGSYLWPWKGGVASGTAVDPKFNIFPIPAANRTANPNLSQNPGY